MTPVRFLRNWRLWNGGEVAGFSEDEAKSLIEAAVAEPFQPESVTPDATVAGVSEPHAVAQAAKPPRGKKG